LATFVKVVLAFVPRVRMDAKHTTTISANMTAYSTAVGPSLDLRKRRSRRKHRRMLFSTVYVESDYPVEPEFNVVEDWLPDRTSFQ
jgi:hypothetical protein